MLTIHGFQTSGPRRLGNLSSAVERRDKQDIVTVLDLIRIFTLKFPICIIDQNKDSGSSIRCALVSYTV
jgi:hypothetical protein